MVSTRLLRKSQRLALGPSRRWSSSALERGLSTAASEQVNGLSDDFARALGQALIRPHHEGGRSARAAVSDGTFTGSEGCAV